MTEAIYHDIRYAMRSLASHPLVTTVAVLSLALGIGVNTAIFSVFERLLLRRLPVAAPEQIVSVTSPGPKPGSRSTSDSGGIDAIFSYPLFRDLERLEAALRLAAHRNFDANLAFKGQTSEGEGLGVTPALGRLLGPDDDRVPAAHPVVVLSHSYWSTRFGADPAVLDDTLAINGEPMTIVGVAPQGFSGTTIFDRPQVFVPLTMAQQAFRNPEWQGLTARNNHWVYVSARLQSGVTRQQAEGLINVPFTALIRDVEYPVLRRGIGTDREREEFQQRQIVLQEGARGRASNRNEAQTILLFMFGITAFVLAIACANVANLLLTRVADRATEISIRVSIGASNGRLIRLLLVEASVLGVLGGIGALGVALMTLTGLLALMPADDLLVLDFNINTTVLLFALALGLGTSLLFGLFPAVHGLSVPVTCIA
jgi:predicted permease